MSQEKHLPTISVVTPSLNQGRYLRACIESILSQNYPNLEFIIIDGGSTDESLSVIREYESRIDYWVSEPDAGQSDAINKGFKRASGELVAWLNADDFYLPGAFDAVVKAYGADQLAPFYFGDGHRVDISGAFLSNFFPPASLRFDRQALVMGLNYILQPSTFINHGALEKAGYLDTGLHYGMDSDLWMRLSALGEPKAVAAALSASREYAATKTASGSFARVEELRKISAAHSGLPMTPGVLCYFLDTLRRFAKEEKDVFPPSYVEDIDAFWYKTAGLFERFDARPDGFPRPADARFTSRTQLSGKAAGDRVGFWEKTSGVFERFSLRSQKNSGSVAAVAAVRPRPSQEVAVKENQLQVTGMKIGIDLRPLTLGASGGMAQLVKGVCEHMFMLHPEHEFLVFCTPFNRSLLEYDAPHVRYFTLPIPAYFVEMDRIASEEQLPVLLRTYPMEDTLHFPMHKQIFLIPDNQHETYPEFFTPEVLRMRRAAFATALRGAGAIGTISEFARKTLLEFPETRCTDFFLMSPALQTSHRLGSEAVELSDSEQALIPSSDYFVFPANLWKHKNHRRLLEAFRLLRHRTKRDISLVLTGHPAGWAELAKDFSDLPVTHIGFVRPELLRVLLERARALLFFSLYEGFGMPLLEAFDAGTPVICSNTTSLPEVGGDAVLSCDPTDVEAIAALMELVLSDEELRQLLVQRGRARLNVYSWEKSAHSLAKACERVAARGEFAEPSLPETTESKHMPLVSIVTPSYNQGRFLKRTIDSVLSQSYPNIEYIVIDGGSTDESVDILRSYGGRFKWVSEKDRGQTHAINKGMARVSGEILAYLNSDDVLAPGAVQSVVDFFRRHPKCDMVYGDADYIDENDQVIGRYNTAEYSFNRLLEDCMVCQPATFWTRRIAEKIGPFDEHLNFTMDYDYWLRIANASGEIHFLPEKLACSRLYPDTKTMSARTKIYKEIFKTCFKHAGQVHQNYYFGYWHHLVHEKDNLASRTLRRRSGLHARLGWLHHKWDHRHRYSLKQVAAFAARRTVRRLAHLGAAGATIAKVVAPAVPMAADIAPVSGFWNDNWLAPTVSIAPRKRVAGQILRLAGVAPVDSVMSITAGDEKLLEFKCTAERYEEVTFLADLVNDKRITVQFSSSITEGTGRQVAFLLHDTNLFSEADIS